MPQRSDPGWKVLRGRDSKIAAKRTEKDPLVLLDLPELEIELLTDQWDNNDGFVGDLDTEILDPSRLGAIEMIGKP